MVYPIFKRGLDILGSGLGLLLFLPAGILIGTLIKAVDGGSVFYGQSRIGRNGKVFKIWKFRSMVPHADRIGGAITQGADPRVTRIGRWLRSTKMDELPQLWNVFVGEMSLVGPRPEVSKYVALYTDNQREILRCRPGITDVASLSFRDEEGLLAGAPDVEGFYVKYCLPKKIELNQEYQSRAGVIGDVTVILRTLGLMFSRVSRSQSGALREPAAVLDSRRECNDRAQARAATRPSLPQAVDALALTEHPSAGRMSRGVADESLRGIKEPMGDSRWAIVGAGPAGRRVANAFVDDGIGRVIGFFDDDPRVWHGVYRGIPVVGMPECLLNAGWKDRVTAVVLAPGDLTGARCRELREFFRLGGLTVWERDGENVRPGEV